MGRKQTLANPVGHDSSDQGKGPYSHERLKKQTAEPEAFWN